LFCAVAFGAAAACGGPGGDGFGGDGGAGDATVDGMGSGDGSPFGDVNFGGDGQAGTLTVTPQNPVLTVTEGGPSVTQQFKALEQGNPVAASWSLDTPGIGTIDANGLFTASGTLGGTADVTAQVGSDLGSTTLTIKLQIDENPGGVSTATQTQLQAGGSGDPAFKFVYPYDATVFPRGLLPPLLQFAGTAATAYYVHISSANIDYQGFYGAGPNVSMTLATWNSIIESVGPKDTLKVQVTKISGSTVSGPITENWTIAQGALKGTLYYNSYDSSIGSGGAVLRIKPAATTPDLFISGCSVCHAVSANGNVLVANHANYLSGASYDLSSGNVNPPVIHEQSDSSFGFGALYPDGTLLLSNASIGNSSWDSNTGGGPNVVGFGTLSGGERASHLYNPQTGAVVGAPGFDGVVTHALMPSFAPDGKMVAFNSYDTGTGHTLSTMTFNVGTKTFAGLTQVVNEAANFPGWPFFTPDSKEVIYHVTNDGDYATFSYNTGLANVGQLKMVDLASKTVTPLNEANGYDGNGKLYLPYGADDQDKNYEPTVLPVAVGGYYWVVFTSRRNYGTQLTANSPTASNRKKLWVAAIDINATPGKDPSHPAFYLPGQELAAGNMRGFWALDPCKQNGNDCSSGDECCTGFCRQVNGDGGAEFTCIPPPGGCSNEFEKCTSSGDCCGVSQGYSCINGFCARPSVN
jgi:hypothetical protein